MLKWSFFRRFRIFYDPLAASYKGVGIVENSKKGYMILQQ